MLKQIVITLFIMIASIHLSASENLTLGQKIAKLKTIPKSERFKLINEIKRDMARLNSSQRGAALGKLRATMRGKRGHKGMMRQQHRQEHQQNPDFQNHERKMDGTGPHRNQKNGGAKQYPAHQK